MNRASCVNVVMVYVGREVGSATVLFPSSYFASLVGVLYTSEILTSRRGRLIETVCFMAYAHISYYGVWMTLTIYNTQINEAGYRSSGSV